MRSNERLSLPDGYAFKSPEQVIKVLLQCEFWFYIGTVHFLIGIVHFLIGLNNYPILLLFPFSRLPLLPHWQGQCVGVHREIQIEAGQLRTDFQRTVQWTQFNRLADSWKVPSIAQGREKPPTLYPSNRVHLQVSFMSSSSPPLIHDHQILPGILQSPKNSPQISWKTCNRSVNY